MSDVVVAESSRTLATLIRLTLEPAGYRLRFASRGSEVLAAIRAGRTDLLILDAGLSEVGGYEIAECVRAEPTIARLPILFTHHDYEAIDRARVDRLRLDDVVTKPFERQSLLERVRALVPPSAATTQDETSHSPLAHDELLKHADQAINDAVARALVRLESRFDEIVAERLEQALDTKVQQLVKSKAEKIVWKAVGELAEDLIREEIARLMEPDPE